MYEHHNQPLLSRKAFYRRQAEHFAIVLGIIGGIIGYIIGTFAGLWLGPELAGLSVKPIPILFVVSLVISISVSIVGSLIPSYLAGRIDPFNNMQEE